MEQRGSMEIRRSNGRWAAFGFILAVGGLAVSAGHASSRIKGGADPGAEIFSAILFFMPFLIIGMFGMLLRSGVIIDGRRQRVTSYWGLLRPMHRVVHYLDESSRIVLHREAHLETSVADNGVAIVVAVRLQSTVTAQGKSGAWPWLLDLVHALFTGCDHHGVLFDMSNKSEPMRELAEQVSGVLGRPVQDQSADSARH